MAKHSSFQGWLAALSLGALTGVAGAQQFVDNTTDIPQGNPFNNSRSENVDFADVDGDGDFDAAFADGGDFDQDQNRLWLNQGPGAGLGTFQDVTATNFPAINDQSRDIEFVDFDNDGDPDLYTSQTAQLINQSNKWWRNTGVFSGVYVDETALRWVNLGVNDGVTTFSSIPPSQVLPSGGFIDWSCDCDFGDLDNDGDLDLVHSSYGGAFNGNSPTRIFLNDGAGFFEEFNPSHFQLTGTNINNGDPALWAEGTQLNNTTSTDGTRADIAASALDIDVGDVDNDLDLDILHGNRQEPPRIFFNRLEENGGTPSDLGFRDVTNLSFPAGWATGNGHYEQEMGDLDNDGDLDIYGLNWAQSGFNFTDITLTNAGPGFGLDGIFANLTLLPNSQSDDNEGDFIDYDNDGDLDLYVCNFSGTDRMYRNDWPGSGNNNFSYSFMSTGTVIPNVNFTGLDADVADVDNDGDYDVFVSNDNNARNVYLQNTLDPPSKNDGHAPRLYRLEQAPNRTPSAAPTVVRVQVYDNAPYYAVWYYDVQLSYTVDGGAATIVKMHSSMGQIFRGEIDGSLVGHICYTVTATDNYGNSAAIGPLCYDSTGGAVTIYCTAKASSAGCVTSIGVAGTNPPSSGASDFSITASNVQGFKNGLLFAGITGPSNIPFSGGILCVNPPNKRGPVMNAGGSNPGACDGSYTQLVNDGMIIPIGLDPGSGNTGWYQWWYRDPNNGAGNLGTALSNAAQVDFL